MELKEKVVLITGASKGLGKGIALAAAKEHAKLLVADKNKIGLEDTKKMIEKSGSKVIASVTDVTKYSDVKNMYSIVMKEYGRLDIVINNAGITNPGGLMPLAEHTNEVYENIMDVNVKGIFFSCKEAVKRMSEDGIIINVSSNVALWGCRGASVYSASKAAIIGLSKSLAKEFMGKIYIVWPPRTATDLYRTHHPDEDQSKLLKINYLKRPEDVGKDIIALCKSGIFDSGSIIRVYGLHFSSFRLNIRKYFLPLVRYIRKYFKITIKFENPAYPSFGGYVKDLGVEPVRAHAAEFSQDK